MQDQIDKITTFLKKTLLDQEKQKLVIAVSGGIDSAASLHLACKAVGARQVFPILLPYGDQATTEAEKMITALDIPRNNLEIINIQPAVEQIESILPHTNQQLDSVRSGNVMARVRMIYVYDYAKRLDALVCGTENKSEKYLGYFTRFGDEASDIEPLQHLYKTQVRQLAEELGVSSEILQKEPSAGLWEGQTDEVELGFSYQDADKVLELLIDQKMPAAEININGVAAEIIQKVVQRVAANQFKHQVPYTL